MREILFRGYSTAERMWIYGDLSHTTDKIVHISNENCFIGVKPETIGQYTGLTDENGKKIFEGDVVTMPAYGGGRHKAVVYFEGGKFAVDGSNWSFKDISPTKMQVIGNIHDNPELMGGDTND
jgi:hypothetical protein